jgi:prepilin-type N-terminal cleavage/methylation domain-containing protein
VSGRARSHAGFTLPELLVSIALMGAVFLALTGALIAGLRHTQGGDTSLRESNALELTAHWFTADVQGAELAAVDDVTAGCGGPALVKLTSPAADRVVAYALTGSPPALVRRVCAPASSAPSESVLVPSVTSARATCNARCARIDLEIAQPGDDKTPGLVSTVRAARRVTDPGSSPP